MWIFVCVNKKKLAHFSIYELSSQYLAPGRTATMMLRNKAIGARASYPGFDAQRRFVVHEPKRRMRSSIDDEIHLNFACCACRAAQPARSHRMPRNKAIGARASYPGFDAQRRFVVHEPKRRMRSSIDDEIHLNFACCQCCSPAHRRCRRQCSRWSAL